MGDRDNGIDKRPRRSLLSFASQPETAGSAPARVAPATPPQAPRREDDLEHYQRMRALRLAASSEITQIPAPEPDNALTDEEAEQIAIDRMRADMAAIKAELNRRIDDNASVAPVSPTVAADTPVAAATSPLKPLADNHVAMKRFIEPSNALNRVINSKKLIIATTLIGTLLGAGYAMTMPKLYPSTAELLVDPSNIPLSGKAPVPGQLPTEASLAIAESQLRAIRSNRVLSQVIDRTGLAKDPEFNGNLKDKGWLAAVRELFSTDSTPDTASREALLVRNLSDNLTVGRSAQNFVFDITVKSSDPQKSARLANTLSDVFIEEQGNPSPGAGTAAPLAGRLNELRSAAEDAENAAQKFRIGSNLADAQGGPADDVAKAGDALAAARDQTIKLNAQAAAIQGASVDSVLGNTVPDALGSDAIAALRSQYSVLKQQADTLAIKLGPRHPLLIQARSEVEAIRKEVRSELSRMAASAQAELKRSVQREQDLANQLAQLKSRTAGTGGDMSRLRALEQDAATKRAAYDAYAQRGQASAQNADMSGTSIRVVSPAQPSAEPAGPSRGVPVIGGMLAGLLAGLGVAMLRGWGARNRPEPSPAGAGNDGPFDPGPPSGGKRAEHGTDNTVAAPAESRLGAAIRQAQTRNSASDAAEMADEDAAWAEDQVAVAQLLYEYADMHFAPRHHDNSNIEDMLADIAEIRDVLRQRAAED
ncbi:GumC family protein [uncultured Phyllobacterium sp.]|uniref:GumC family protein n=1 Tax=uncultured Phyllobacterium sp. TaxID=253813 RepID=UPI002585012E|nr:GumC family protein [uncultured Phyllobacterium sp.]